MSVAAASHQREGKMSIIDVEQEITHQTLADLAGKLSFREEVPSRLMWRALVWAFDEIARQREDIQSVIRLAAKIKINSEQ